MTKKHLPLIVALALPVIFIGILALVIVLPSAKINPQHDFVFVDTDLNKHSYAYEPAVYRNEYVITNGKIEKRALVTPTDEARAKLNGLTYADAPPLYYYSVRKQTSREISFEDAQKIEMIAGPSSPDGYTVEYDYGSDGIFELFGSRSDDGGYMISKGNARKELAGISTSPNYYGGYMFVLVGWVKANAYE